MNIIYFYLEAKKYINGIAEHNPVYGGGDNDI